MDRTKETKTAIQNLSVVVGILVLVSTFSVAAFQTSGALIFDLSTLGTGPLLKMSTPLVKGILFFSVKVLEVHITFSDEYSNRLRELTRGQVWSNELTERIGETALMSRDVLIEVHFTRDFGLDRFLKEAISATRKVYRAGIIDKDSFEQTSRNLPAWYANLKKRGIRQGDKMFYRIQDGVLHTSYHGVGGEIFLNLVNHDEMACLTVLGGYFVPGSDFRDGLIQSLFTE